MANIITINRKEIEEGLGLAATNPSVMLRVGLNTLVKASQGKADLVDASTPAALLLEMSAVMAANNLKTSIRTDAQHYPKLASSISDLYHHMNDDIYGARFATPSMARFAIGFHLGELRAQAVETKVKGVKQITIPRFSTIVVDGTEFTFLYPVIIRLTTDESIQVLYDTREQSDIERLESNMINYWYSMDSEVDNANEMLVLDMPLLQVSRRVFDTGITHEGNILNKQFEFADSFLQANVYLADAEGRKTKIQTTHSNLVYDPNVVTARLSVLEGGYLSVDIPAIYYRLGLVDQQSVIVEIFTSKGALDMPLTEIQTKSGVGFRAMEDENQIESEYSNMFDSLDILVAARTGTIGGTNAASFEEVKRWVIEGSTDKRPAITHADITTRAEFMGYTLQLDIDQVTNRVYQAMRELESSTRSEFTRGVGCSIEPVAVQLDNLKHHTDVNVHDGRYTILPSAMFRSLDGKTMLLNREDIPKIDNTTIDQFIMSVNRLEYVYTPFHYCLDTNGKNFRMRAYYMDSPEDITKQFVQANHLVPFTVSVDKVLSVSRSEKGYKIIILTRASETYKKFNPEDLFVQLSFIPEGEVEHAYINGKFLGLEKGNHVWEFEIETTFDFDTEDRVMLNNFKILTRENRRLACKLLNDFHVIFGVYDYQYDGDMQELISLRINERSATFLLERNRRAIVVAENSIRIQLGSALTDLWKNTRTVASLRGYKRHEEDVPLLYTEDIYEVGEDGLLRYELDEDGHYSFLTLHRKGDPVMESGEPVLLHRKGDIMQDENGEPIVVEESGALRILDIFFLDGIYRFATDQSDIDYIRSIPKLVVNWLENDIRRMKINLMENTHLYFMPKRTMGYIDILVENQIERRIFNRLPFEITYYLTDDAYRNEDIKNTIRARTSVVVNEALRQRVISKDKIEHDLRIAAGEENIHGVNIVDMGIGKEINTFTLLKDGDYCSVRRKIGLQADGALKVKEEIMIHFVNHSRKI